MFTPFEELEYLADFLPEEGEAIIVSRQFGELRCSPIGEDSLRDGVEDADLYGRLVEANELLNAQGVRPIWVCLLGWFWFSVTLFMLGDFGWSEWYLPVGLALLTASGCYHWIHVRQRRLFDQMIAPQLRQEMERGHFSVHALIAGVRQHVEFRTLLDELVQWRPERRKVVR
ncbi:MAG: hypothetical protein R3C01_09845 [Planctomycetaceae bacterium]